MTERYKYFNERWKLVGSISYGDENFENDVFEFREFLSSRQI